MSNPKAHDEDDLPVMAMRALYSESLLSIDHAAHTGDVMVASPNLIDSLHSMTLVTQEKEDHEGDFKVEVRTLTGDRIRIPRLTQATRVLKLMEVIFEKLAMPFDQQRLVFGGNQMESGRTLGSYGVSDGSVLHVLRLRGGWLPLREFLDPEFNYDFTNMDDEGVSYSRGNEVYKRPYGWKRYALKVRGKYDSDLWLGKPGLRHHSSDGEWPVSYHGTSKTGMEGIAEKGYDMAKGKRFVHGRGIYSTPDPGVAKSYALPFKHKGEPYLVMLQNRYDPNHTKFIKSENYLVTKKEKFIRPYGILVRKA